jgi:hypothetical protein
VLHCVPYGAVTRQSSPKEKNGLVYSQEFGNETVEGLKRLRLVLRGGAFVR